LHTADETIGTSTIEIALNGGSGIINRSIGELKFKVALVAIEVSTRLIRREIELNGLGWSERRCVAGWEFHAVRSRLDRALLYFAEIKGFAKNFCHYNICLDKKNMI